MRLIIALFFYLCVQLYAATELNSSSTSFGYYDTSSLETNKSISLENNLTDINASLVPTEENNTQKAPEKQTVFISYTKSPDQVFLGEQFSVKVKAIITTDNFNEIKNSIIPSPNINILNRDDNWTKKSDYEYEKIFYARAEDTNVTFPQIYFELYKDGNLTYSQIFPNLPLKVIKLNSNAHFSNVIADWLDIVKVKTTKFDEYNNMVVLEIKAKNANLKDFKLSWVIRDGVDSYFDNFPISRIYYYAIVPKYKDKFVFKYFNIKQNRFIKKSINLVIDNENISTQSDLNPTQSSFNLYKNIAYGTLALILLFIFIKRRRVIYLLLFIVLAVMFYLNINPLSTIKIAKNTKVYILPTKNSTLFYSTAKVEAVQKLNTRGDYIKVILPDKKIGWIKEKNVIKN